MVWWRNGWLLMNKLNDIKKILLSNYNALQNG